MGGVAALIFWAVISLWPNLLILALGFGVISFFIARWMYAVVPNRLTFDFWNNSLLTMIILIGPTVSDSQSGTDIDQAIVIRMAIFIALSFYAFVLVHVLDYWRDNCRTPVVANDTDGPNTAV